MNRKEALEAIDAAMHVLSEECNLSDEEDEITQLFYKLSDVMAFIDENIGCSAE